jgi:hypothetical protein
MSKMYFFGDSYVENLGCRPGDEYYLKTFTGVEKTWTRILSERHDLEEVNLGESGFTNYNFLNQVWSYMDKFTSKDKVIIRIGPYDRYNIDSATTKIKRGDLLKADKTGDTPIYFYPIARDTSDHYRKKLSTRLSPVEIETIINFNTYILKTNKFRKQFIKNAFKNISTQLRGKNVTHFIFDHEWLNFFDDWNDIKNIHNIIPGHLTWEQHKAFAELIHNQL